MSWGHALFPTSSELGVDQVQVLSQASSGGIIYCFAGSKYLRHLCLTVVKTGPIFILGLCRAQQELSSDPKQQLRD